MNTVSLLLVVLFCTLMCGGIGSIVLFFRGEDDKRYEKIAAIASMMASIGSIVVGIITVKVMMHQEESEKLRNQPLYTIHISQNYSPNKGVFDNEEYVISNEGSKSRSRTTVSCQSIMEVTYQDYNARKFITRFCPLYGYWGASFTTGNLEGIIQSSAYSGNNNELFVSLYREGLEYSEKHPGITIAIQLKHYFTLEYEDVYGEKHTVVKTKDTELDRETFSGIIKQAYLDSGGKSFSVSKLDLDEIIESCFKDYLASEEP